MDSSKLWERLNKCQQLIKAKNQSWTTTLANARASTGERASRLQSEAEVTRLQLVRLSTHQNKLKDTLEGKQTDLTDSEDDMAGNPWDIGTVNLKTMYSGAILQLLVRAQSELLYTPSGQFKITRKNSGF